MAGINQKFLLIFLGVLSQKFRLLLMLQLLGARIEYLEEERFQQFVQTYQIRRGKDYLFKKFGIIVGRVVHKSSRVMFVPDSKFSSGRKSKLKLTHFNGQIIRFGSVGFRQVVSRFRVLKPVPIFCQISQDLADIWPDLQNLNQISPNLVDFMLLFVGKSKISPNLVDCSGFQEALCRKTFGSHRILLILWSGQVAQVFGEETRQPT